jgi:hypothetical protein
MVKTGDRVKMIDSGITGICKAVHADGTVSVETSDGLLIPVNSSDIIVSSPESMMVLDKISAKAENKKRGRELKTGRKIASGSHRSANPANVTAEVDLHLKMKSTGAGSPTPEDIIAIQISRFHLAMRKALKENKRELIVIHGEGSGRLKSEIMRIIAADYPDKRVMDAPYHKYGYGAAMIILK